MLIQEIITINNTQLKHTYSSTKNYIKQIETGVIYDQAYDLTDREFTYEETDTVIPEEFL